MVRIKKNMGTVKPVLDIVKDRARRGELNESDRIILDWSKRIDRGQAWWVLLALFGAMCTSLGPYRIYSLIFARVTNEGSLSREEASWPVSMIYTAENLVGPLVSILVYHISYKQTYLIGSLLLIAGNGFAALSSSLWLDTLLIGVVQGVGFSFLFMPIMEIINSYFIRYRSLALGLSLSGGTLSIFILSPIFQWLLEVYPWRYSYLGIAIFCSLNLLTIPLLKPNPMPQEMLTSLSRPEKSADVEAHDDLKLRSSIQAVSAASPGGLISDSSKQPDKQVRRVQLSSHPIEASPSSGATSILFDLLKTPAFHLIWFNQVLYYWLFTIWCLVMVDYGLDRGFTPEQANWLLSFQSAGELLGRLVLSLLIDMQFIAARYCNILTLLLLAGSLVIVTLVQTHLWLATMTVTFTALLALHYIQLNSLLVEHVGEGRVTLGFGASSFISGLLMVFRPQALGYFRDHHGNYEPLLICLAAACSFGALLWLLEPLVTATISKKRRRAETREAGKTNRDKLTLEM